LPFLTKVHQVGIVSIPRPSGLDELDDVKHAHDAVASLEIPEDISSRISFALEIGPKGSMPETFGVALNYEIYSAIVRVIPTSGDLPANLVDHFITGMPTAGAFNSAQNDPENAELAFHRAIHGSEISTPIFREDSGAYVVLAGQPMRVPPKLKVSFNRSDLRAEQISFDYSRQPSHKVRFWIYDKGGRNKKDDLRRHITSIELDARL
jgi:hypothetical protein